MHKPRNLAYNAGPPGPAAIQHFNQQTIGMAQEGLLEENHENAFYQPAVCYNCKMYSIDIHVIAGTRFEQELLNLLHRHNQTVLENR